MKKKSIPMAQMGKSYIQRRAFKSPGAVPKKDNNAPKVPEKVIKAPKSKATSDYRLYSESEIDNYTPTSREPSPRTSSKAETKSDEKPKGLGSTGGSKGGDSSAPKSRSTAPAKAETKSESKPVDRTKKITPKRQFKGVALPERNKPTVPGPQKERPARTYSDVEKKMQEVMAKGKQADGTMSESAQAKLKALQAKRRAGNEKAERQKNRSNRRAIAKSVRAGKFNARQIKKSAK